MDLQLHDKTALVTGSSKGIGAAIARKLAQEGATVIVHGRNREQAEGVAHSITGEGGRAHVVIGDLTSESDVQGLISEAEAAAGTIDILVNNAGGSGGSKGGWSSATAATWATAYDRNVLAALRMITRILPGMQAAKWGRIINISSLAATMPPAGAGDYAAAKAGMNAMTGSLAKATAADRITVNAISPGTIHSDTFDKTFRATAAERGLAKADAPWEEIERTVLPLFAQVPMGRVGTVEELAATAAFLASPLAAYITGVNLRLDGGMAASGL